MFKSAAEVKTKADAYFASLLPDETTGEFSRPPTIPGLARALGCTTPTLSNYESDGTEISDAILSAKQRIEIYLAESLMTHKSVGGPIFALCHSFGWKNTMRMEHNGSVAITDEEAANEAYRIRMAKLRRADSKP